MQSGKRKPASYHAISPKLWNSLDIVGTTVPMMVRSWRMISHGRETLVPDLPYQCNEKDGQVDSGHSWQNDSQRRIGLVILFHDQVFCVLDLCSIDLAFNLVLDFIIHLGRNAMARHDSKETEMSVAI